MALPQTNLGLGAIYAEIFGEPPTQPVSLQFLTDSSNLTPDGTYSIGRFRGYTHSYKYPTNFRSSACVATSDNRDIYMSRAIKNRLGELTTSSAKTDMQIYKDEARTILADPGYYSGILQSDQIVQVVSGGSMSKYVVCSGGPSYTTKVWNGYSSMTSSESGVCNLMSRDSGSTWTTYISGGLHYTSSALTTLANGHYGEIVSGTHYWSKITSGSIVSTGQCL